MSYAIFQEQKIQEFSHNVYDDVGVFWPSYFFLINLIILPLEMWSKWQIHNFED
jgi:hypothetical protein